MEVTNQSLEWSTENIDLWRQFLSTPTGQRLIPKMLEAAPSLLSAGDTNAILIRNGELRGFQEAARTLLELTSYPPPPQSPAKDNYPPLDSDAGWEGPKLNETPQA